MIEPFFLNQGVRLHLFFSCCLLVLLFFGPIYLAAYMFGGPGFPFWVELSLSVFLFAACWMLYLEVLSLATENSLEAHGSSFVLPFVFFMMFSLTWSPMAPSSNSSMTAWEAHDSYISFSGIWDWVYTFFAHFSTSVLCGSSLWTSTSLFLDFITVLWFSPYWMEGLAVNSYTFPPPIIFLSGLIFCSDFVVAGGDDFCFCLDLLLGRCIKFPAVLLCFLVLLFYMFILVYLTFLVYFCWMHVIFWSFLFLFTSLRGVVMRSSNP